MLEFFAGKANVSKCMKISGRAVASFDINYDGWGHRDRKYASNVMDILSPSGFSCHALRFGG